MALPRRRYVYSASDENIADRSTPAQDKKGKPSASKDKGKESKAEPNEVKAWAEGYDKKKWLVVASKHYDRTGQRITAEQARKMAEGK